MLRWKEGVRDGEARVVDNLGDELCAKLPGFKSWLYNLVSEGLWASYLPSPCLSFLICKLNRSILVSSGCYNKNTIDWVA